MAELGFAIAGGLGLDAAAEADLAVEAIDAGLGPVFITEVAGATATCVAAAVATKRPGHALGTGILPLGSRTTATLAMEAVSVTALSGAPFLLGLGVSTRQIVEDWHRVERRATLAHTRATITDLREILAGQRRGPFRLTTSAQPPVRILLAALGPRMTELACTAGDGTILTLTPADTLPDLHGTESYVYIWVRASDDADLHTRRRITAYTMATPYARHFTNLGYGAMVSQIRRLHEAGRLRDAPDVVPGVLLDRLFVAVEDVEHQGSEYVAAGVTPVVMPVSGADPNREMSDLLTALRSVVL